MNDHINKLLHSTNLLSRVNEVAYHYSPRKCVYEKGNIKLYHYQKHNAAIPLLLVFATVNRPEILDIFPDRSLIKDLLDKNQNIYLLDWGYPEANDSKTSFGVYVNQLDKCIKEIQKKSGYQKINVLGICQGGVISLCQAALSDSINKLILISTPVDFHTNDNLVSNLLKKIDMQTIASTLGNIPGAWLTDFFISLRPFELVGKKYLRFLENADNPDYTDKFLRVEKWLRDAPDQPGQAFAEFVRECYQQNKLIAGEFNINNQIVDLKKITIPVFNIMAASDEIVPASASRPLKQYISSRSYQEQVFPSGHIGIYVSDKVGARLASEITDWLM